MNAKRTEAALNILKAGGRFVCRLERDAYMNREQFRYRLIDANWNVVKGHGFKTFDAIRHLLAIAPGGTSVSTYYAIRAE